MTMPLLSKRKNETPENSESIIKSAQNPNNSTIQPPLPSVSFNPNTANQYQGEEQKQEHIKKQQDSFFSQQQHLFSNYYNQMPPLSANLQDLRKATIASVTETPILFIQDNQQQSLFHIQDTQTKSYSSFPTNQFQYQQQYQGQLSQVPTKMQSEETNYANNWYTHVQPSTTSNLPHHNLAGYSNFYYENKQQQQPPFFPDQTNFIPLASTSNTLGYAIQQHQSSQSLKNNQLLHPNSVTEHGYYTQYPFQFYQQSFPNIPEQFGSHYAQTDSQTTAHQYGLPDTDQGNQNLKRKYRLWSEEEDILLYDLKKVKMMSWKEVAHNFPDRTLHACQFRWRKLSSFIGEHEENDTHLSIIKDFNEQLEKDRSVDSLDLSKQKRREDFKEEQVKDPQARKISQNSQGNSGNKIRQTLPVATSLEGKRKEAHLITQFSKEKKLTTFTIGHEVPESPKINSNSILSEETSDIASIASNISNVSSNVNTPNTEPKRSSFKIRDILN